MKGKKSTAVAMTSAISHQVRVGEDWVPVVSRHGTSIDLDIRNAPAPARQYTSDVAGIIVQRRVVQLVFGQSRVDGQFRNMIVISMPFDSVRALLRSFEVMRASRNQLVARGVEVEALAKIQNEPETTVGMTATIAFIGVSGYDTCLDFYYHSPMGLEKAATSSRLPVVPIVRINVPTGVFFGLWDGMRDMEPKWPKLVKEDV